MGPICVDGVSSLLHYPLSFFSHFFLFLSSFLWFSAVPPPPSKREPRNTKTMIAGARFYFYFDEWVLILSMVDGFCFYFDEWVLILLMVDKWVLLMVAGFC